MGSIYVNGTTAGLIERSVDLMEAKSAGGGMLVPVPGDSSPEVPQWLPNGEECTQLKDAAAIMGLSLDVAARYIVECDYKDDLYDDAANYIESKTWDEDAHPRVGSGKAGGGRFAPKGSKRREEQDAARRKNRNGKINLHGRQPGTEKGTIKIEKGDTLSDLAEKFRTTVDHLMEMNPSIKDKDKIYAGANLKVPDTRTPYRKWKQKAIEVVEEHKAQRQSSDFKPCARCGSTRVKDLNGPGQPRCAVCQFHLALKSMDDDMEGKAVRHVRTPAGKKRYGQPIGSIIVRDGASPLKHISASTSQPYKDDGYTTVTSKNGQNFHIAEEEDGSWSVVDDNDKVLGTAKTEEAIYQKADTLGGKAPSRTRGGSVTTRQKDGVNSDTHTATGLPRDSKQRAEFSALDKSGRDRYKEAVFEGDSHRDAMAKVKKQRATNTQQAATGRSNAATRARATASRGAKPVDKENLQQSGRPTAANVRAGDIVAPSWAQDSPGRVERVGPITKTGKVTIYYEGGSRQTYKVDERLVGFKEKNRGN